MNPDPGRGPQNPVSYTHLDVYKRQEKERETETGLTKTEVGANRAKNYDGFTALLYDLSLIHISSRPRPDRLYIRDTFFLGGLP